MQPTWRTLLVVPSLPERLSPLNRLAHNLWYTWNQDAIELFRRLDRDLWEEVYHNPVLLLARVRQERLEEASTDESFLLHLDSVMERFDQYMELKSTYSFQLEKHLDPSFRIAYLSAEYGLTECLPIYSGGLGMLSGDHLKSSSNLRLPLVGLGLLYQKGYFGQYLNSEGWQQEYYAINDYDNTPVFRELDGSGRPVAIGIPVGDHMVTAEVWHVQVGRVPLYLLSTYTEDNRPEDREITSELYGGDREMRIRQEIVLGMGGVRALRALGIRPSVFHMNEGHSAFAQLERIRILIKEHGLSFEAAIEAVKASGVFTTHTPVPAGNDYFDPGLLERYFRSYADDIGVPFHRILGLGRQHPDDPHEPFCMTVLALKLSTYKNGVSRLHRDVSRQMWHGIWRGFPIQDSPIIAITNGVHVPSYISKEMADLYNRYLGPRWIEEPDSQKVWEGVDRIPDTELWRTHERRRERLIAFARRKLKEQLIRRGAMPSEIQAAEDVLDPEALTIGFSRRFAAYKRGDLLFRDPDRLAQILNHPQRPVQILFAGKAHPQDSEGKRLIKNIVQFARQERFRYRVVFLEDYDVVIARYLVQGADLWLNTPRRPMEACGTSGMKAVANGALHMSILDGWWVEGYGLERGWAIGAGEQYDDPQYQDEVESRAIYDLLEKEVVPLFYERGRDGAPRKWIAMMKSSMRTLCPIFNSHRMVEDYMDKCYIPASELFEEIQQDNMKRAEEFALWKKRVAESWQGIHVKQFPVDTDTKEVVTLGTEYPLSARIFLGALRPEDVQVELYYGVLSVNGELKDVVTQKMVRAKDPEAENGYIYQGTIRCTKSGRIGFDIRILPKHPLLVHPCDMGLIIWA